MFLWWNNKESEVAILLEIERKEDDDDRCPTKLKGVG
jgi:hypothetical protein